MSKLEKPKFFAVNSFINIIGMIGFIIGIIQFIIPENILCLKHKIIIFIFTCIFCLILYLITYIAKWHKFYNNYLEFENRFNELENRYIKRINEINNKETLINEYEFLVNYLQEFIKACLTRNSAKETQQILNLQKYIFAALEHINKLKGGQ